MQIPGVVLPDPSGQYNRKEGLKMKKPRIEKVTGQCITEEKWKEIYNNAQDINVRGCRMTQKARSGYIEKMVNAESELYFDVPIGEVVGVIHSKVENLGNKRYPDMYTWFGFTTISGQATDLSFENYWGNWISKKRIIAYVVK